MEQRAAPSYYIVVVEDSALVAALLTRLLHAIYPNARVKTIADGSSVLDIVAIEMPHLVITDLLMPRCDGIEVITALRAAGHTLPIVLMSGIGDLRARDAAIGAGASAFLYKPFQLAELRTLLAPFLSLSEPNT